jgi:hypothetical protein
MPELAFLTIALIGYGHLLLLWEQPNALKFVHYRTDGFAALWVSGVFIRYIDLR